MHFLFKTSSIMILLGVISATAYAGEIYRWKDENNITHSSDTPPVGRKYQTITVNQSITTVKEEVVKESANCTESRRILDLLNSNAAVAVKEDDTTKNNETVKGKSTPMSAEEREKQKKLAEAAIAAYCKQPDK